MAAGLGSSPGKAPAARVERVLDLRLGFVATPMPSPGYHPAGDAGAFIASRSRSPAQLPVAGIIATGSYAADQRYVIKIPSRWNGSLAVLGTPGFRSEFANDALWGDYLLARGFAYASSNKGIPYNMIVEPATQAQPVYTVPFDPAGMTIKGQSMRLGALTPKKVPIAAWNDDLAALTKFAVKFCTEHGGSTPLRTYALGYSEGGAQVRSLVERRPELVDGGVDWSGPYWSVESNLLLALPKLLDAMPQHVAQNFKPTPESEALVQAGFPADVVQPDAEHPSLWYEYYANQPTFFADLAVFAYALLVDPAATAQALSTPEARAAYRPSTAAQFALTTFAHTGKIGKPLISITSELDPYVAPAHHGVPYLDAVRSAGRSAQYWQYCVRGATHVDAYTAFGFRLRPALPFAWAAFEQLVAVVERGYAAPGAGSAQMVDSPAAIALP